MMTKNDRVDKLKKIIASAYSV